MKWSKTNKELSFKEIYMEKCKKIIGNVPILSYKFKEPIQFSIIEKEIINLIQNKHVYFYYPIYTDQNKLVSSNVSVQERLKIIYSALFHLKTDASPVITYKKIKLPKHTLEINKNKDILFISTILLICILIFYKKIHIVYGLFFIILSYYIYNI